jgi:rubrerythrin
MENCTLEQAIRNAVVSEQAAVRYFQTIAARESSPAARALCLHFAEREGMNATRLEHLALRVEEGELAHYGELQIGAVPSAPSWTDMASLSNLEALGVARDCAYRAAFFYDILAEASPTHSPLFRDLASNEEELAHRLERLMRLARVAAAVSA